MKRSFDLVVTLFAILFASPLFAVIAIAVAFKLGRPILFRHLRPGLMGKPFILLKFRTMSNASDSEDMPLPDAVRLNGFGRWLRASSLDELPELWNVLRGEMSLVGPRPLLPEYMELYTRRQARRHEVRPGLTGWAQVNGRNSISWEQKFEYDVWYVENQSFYLDMKIVWLTLWNVLRREGISQPGHATTERFTGSPND